MAGPKVLSEDLVNCKSLSFVVSDVERFHSEEVKTWQKKLIESFDLTFHGGRFGKVLLVPQVLKEVFKKDGRFYLQLDYKLRLQPANSVHRLLKEGRITVEELKFFRFRPAGFSGTLELLTVRKADQFPEEFFLKKAETATRNITKRWWRDLAENRALRKETLLLEFDKGYVYPAQIVFLSLSMEDLADETDLSSVSKKWKVPPEERWKLIKGLVLLMEKLFKNYKIGLERTPLPADGRVEYHNEVIDAANNKANITKSAFHFLKECKPFLKKETIRVSFLFLDERKKSGTFEKSRASQLREVLNFIQNKGIKVEKGAILRLSGKVGDLKREFLQKIDRFEGSDLVIVSFDGNGTELSAFEETGLYQLVKGKLLERNVPSQFINNRTFQRWSDYVMLNVAEQIMAKTGNVPYRLSRRLEDIDVFIGLDISRLRRDKNTLNAGVFTKFFFSDGSFVRYFVQGGQTFGEKLTGQFIEALFQKLAELKLKPGSRITVHRDGRVWKEEVKHFKRFSEEYGYSVGLFEVIKRNNPRFFSKTGLLKGQWVCFDDDSAVVATYDTTVGTHQPVYIRRVLGSLPIEKAVSHLLSFTLLNYSSFKPIRLPATVHYADKISTMVAKGMVPERREGETMFWL